jgi:hypothetical protein
MLLTMSPSTIVHVDFVGYPIVGLYSYAQKCGIFVELYIKSVFSGRYRSVFLGIYHTDTEGNLGRYISVSFFWREPLFPQKGGTGPLFEEKGGIGPLFDTASPPLAEKRSSRQISNTDRKYPPPSKSDTSKIPIPKKLLVTPWYTTLDFCHTRPTKQPSIPHKKPSLKYCIYMYIHRISIQNEEVSAI